MVSKLLLAAAVAACALAPASAVSAKTMIATWESGPECVDTSCGKLRMAYETPTLVAQDIDQSNDQRNFQYHTTIRWVEAGFIDGEIYRSDTPNAGIIVQSYIPGVDERFLYFTNLNGLEVDYADEIHVYLGFLIPKSADAPMSLVENMDALFSLNYGGVDIFTNDFYRSLAFGNEARFSLSEAVPEPATWAMMIGGFGFVGAAARRRRTQISYA